MTFAAVPLPLAAKTREMSMPAWTFPPMAEEVGLYAQQAGVLIGELPSTLGEAGVKRGDLATVLVTLQDGERARQWLWAVEVDEPAKGDRLPREFHTEVYSTTGTEFTLRSRYVVLKWRLVGPFESGKRMLPTERSGRLVVNAGFLEMGIDRACEALIARRAEAAGGASAAEKMDYELATKPFPPARIDQSRAVALRLGFTPERELALWQMGIALPEFVRLAARTPGLQEIFREVAEVSWWTMLTAGGKPKFQTLPVSAAVTKVRNTKPTQYNLPVLLEVGGDPVLVLTLVAMEARSPVSCLAGIVALQARRIGDHGPQLSVQLVAAKSAAR